MTYDEAIAFWYGRINYEIRTPGPADLKLDRMRALLELLGNPHRRVRIVHVAGSKGKGSTSAMVAAVLQAAGYRVGLFTSPHLVSVEERIAVDGVKIGRDELAALMSEIKSAVQRYEERSGADSPTFFEIVTALGFMHFVRRRVDVAVLEVGLGGRFDSTNVCSPLVSIITSISYDHTRQLGSTLDRIAGEKAGIVKPHVPVVSGATGPEASAVIAAKAREQGARLRQLGRDFRYHYQPAHVTAEKTEPARVQITTREREWPSMELGLIGEHQAANAAVALAALEELCHQGFAIPEAAVRSGFARVRWPARMEVVSRKPLIVIDCAHNVASIQALVDTLEQSFPATRRLLVFAGSNDKDLAGMLRVLPPHFAHVFLTCFQNSPRAVPPEQLMPFLPGSQPSKSAHPTAANALRAARIIAHPDDLICIAGSVFLAGELRNEFGIE
jgi:dihydrofolate synthase/folylpolyglutamate synthase